MSVKCAVDVSLLRNACDWRLSGDGVHTAGMVAVSVVVVVAVMRPATFGLFSVTAGERRSQCRMCMKRPCLLIHS